jgi:hypothetical protein
VSRIGGVIRDVLGAIIRPFRRTRQRTPTQWQWGYRCEWIDPATGAVVTDSYTTVLTDSPTNYQQAAALARRVSSADPPSCITYRSDSGAGLRLRCRRKGPIIGVP